MSTSIQTRFGPLYTQFLHDRRGVTALEYGMIAALIAVAIIGILTSVGGQLKNTFASVNNAL